MQVVIEIPEEQYDALCMKGVFALESQLPSFLKVLRNGTPLPKGHGDLIDRDELIKDRVSNDITVILANTAKTLIPADKEGD